MNELLKPYEEKMQKTVAGLTTEYASIRAGRANPAVLNKVFVDYYGTPTPINQMASVSVSQATTLVIQPYDKSTLKEIEKAINMSDIGINPNNDGSVIRLAFPPMTSERRKELCKDISKYAEEAKIAVRNARRDANDKIKAAKKNSEITEDEQKTYEKDVQDLTDKFCKQIDTISADKEKEIMEI